MQRRRKQEARSNESLKTAVRSPFSVLLSSQLYFLALFLFRPRSAEQTHAGDAAVYIGCCWDYWPLGG